MTGLSLSQIIRGMSSPWSSCNASSSLLLSHAVCTLRGAQRCHELTFLFACRIGIADADRSSVCLIVSSGPAAPSSALVCVFHMYMHIGLDMHGIKIPSCMLSQCCICTSDGVSVCVHGQTTVIDIVLARPVFLDSLRATFCLTCT
jgi:hypothetical protein